MDSRNNYKVIGLMSGTSLDGLDIAYCTFRRNKTGWTYSVDKAITQKYPKVWKQKLSTAHQLSGEELVALDVKYGEFLGKACRTFIDQHNLRVHFIASHGHTIFHQPQRGFTFQLGNGNALRAASGLPVVFDFRSLDVLLGGEGAPLVPAGDKLLFRSYDICLNLGGIANLSMDIKGKRVAYDICFCNMGLNYLMETKGKSFDDGGMLASTGKINSTMLRQLNKIYTGLLKKLPSLGREIFENKIRPIIDQKGIPLKDKLCTLVESAAMEIGKTIPTKTIPTILCTGGGAYNSFFISRLLEHTGDRATLVIPEDDVVNFKEALVFAFLGVLRVRGEKNCLKSVTGASRDSSSGLLAGF